MEGPPKKIKVEGAPIKKSLDDPLETARIELENPPAHDEWDAMITGGEIPPSETAVPQEEPPAPNEADEERPPIGRWRMEESPVESPLQGGEAFTEAVAQVENAPPSETTPAIFGITPEELAQTEGWGELSEGQKRLALENLKQITLARIKEESAGRYKKNITEEKTGKALWRRMLIGMRENFAKSYTTLKLEKTVAEELKEGGMAMHGEVLAQVVRAAKNGPEVEIKENGEMEFVYLSEKIAGFSVEFSPEDHEKTEAYNSAATEFARIPDEWKYEVASDRQRRAYEKAREKYEAARGNILEMIYLSERSLNASEPGAQENAMLFVNSVDGMVRMNQFFNTHPDAEKEIAKIEDRSLWKRIVWNMSVLEKAAYGLGGYGVRWATTSMLGLVGAPLAAAGIGGFRARKKAGERVSEQEIMARRGGTEKYEQWQKNIVDAESLTKKLETLSNQMSEVDEGVLASDLKRNQGLTRTQVLARSLAARVEYTQRKLDDELVGFGRAEKKVDNQYKLLNALAFARTALEAGTREGNGVLSARFERFLKFKERNIPEARRKFLNREFFRGAATAAGFATAGWLIRDFFHEDESAVGTAVGQAKEKLRGFYEALFPGDNDTERYLAEADGDAERWLGGFAREEIPPPSDEDMSALDSAAIAEKDITEFDSADLSEPGAPLTRGWVLPPQETVTPPQSPPSPGGGSEGTPGVKDYGGGTLAEKQTELDKLERAVEGLVSGPELSETEMEVQPDVLTQENLDAMQAEESTSVLGHESPAPLAGLSPDEMAAEFGGVEFGPETPMVTPEQIRDFARGSENYFAASREMFRDAANRVANADRMIRDLYERQGVPPEDALNDPAVKKELEDAEKIFREATEMRARGHDYVQSMVMENPALTPEAKLEIIGTLTDDAERVSHLAKLATLVDEEPAMQQFAERDLYPSAVDDWVRAHGNAVSVNEELMAKHPELRAARDAMGVLIEQKDALEKEIAEHYTSVKESKEYDTLAEEFDERDTSVQEVEDIQKGNLSPEELEQRQHEIEDINRALDEKTKEFADMYKKVMNPEGVTPPPQAVAAARQLQEVNTIDAIHKKFYEGNGTATEVDEVVKIMKERMGVFDMNGEERILGAEETLAGKKFMETFDKLSYYEQEGFLSHLRQHLESVKNGGGSLGGGGARYRETLENLTDTLEKRVKIPASETPAPELVKAVSEAFTGERAAEARDLIHRYAITHGGVSTEKLTAFAKNMNNIDKGTMNLLFKEGGDSEENRLELFKTILRHKWFEIDRFSFKQMEIFEDLIEDSDRFGGILKYLDNEKISFEERRQMLANYLAQRTLSSAEDPRVTKDSLLGIVRSIAPEGRKGAIELLVRNAVFGTR